MNANPILVRLFDKLNKRGIKCITEIPTYPYDSEFKGYPLKYKIPLYIDKLFRKALAKKMEAIVTFSNEETIFGKRTICISTSKSKKVSQKVLNDKGLAKYLYKVGKNISTIKSSKITTTKSVTKKTSAKKKTKKSKKPAAKKITSGRFTIKRKKLCKKPNINLKPSAILAKITSKCSR